GRVAMFFGNVSSMIERSLRHGVEIGLVRPCDVGLVASASLGAIRGVLSHLLTRPEAPSLEQLSNEYPEIPAMPVESPVFIAGLARTGTTLLHRLLGSYHSATHTSYAQCPATLP
ncbi:MAG: sulfotransferase, partial [Planctomycetes bacterium]|nr:sulfotransferase [Planctomycetota bacterium]